MICGIYLIIYASKLDRKDYYDLQSLIDYWWGLKPESQEFYNKARPFSCVLLSIVSGGLLTAYAILVYNIRKYFKGQMVLEMCRLTILFAVFCICYGLRTFYQYELGNFREWPLLHN